MRRRVALLAGALVLAAGWLWVHAASWEPDYRKAPDERTAVHPPRDDRSPGRGPAGTWPWPVESPPPGVCTPPPGDRDVAYTCAYSVLKRP